MSDIDMPDFASTSLVSTLADMAPMRRADGVWRSAWRRFRRDRVGMVSLAIVAAYALLIACTGSGLVARHWQDEVGVPDAPPSFLAAAAPAQPGVALPAGVA